MVKWAIKLGEFDISYRLRTAIKGQVLADFLANLIPVKIDERSSPESEWTLHVDGSSTASTNGAGLLLITLEGIEIEYAIRLRFNATNNEAEFKTLIARLNMVKEAGAIPIAAYTDSTLVEGQCLASTKLKKTE